MPSPSTRKAVVSHQFSLLHKKKFAPFFITLSLGAFTDNVYKNALIALIAFASINDSSLSKGVLVNLAAGLFILPFFIFSAIGGQLADQCEKSLLIKRIKFAELIIMVIGLVGLVWSNLVVMLFALFLLGVQSAFFGPVKYSLLPQVLSEAELTGGNALVELGTFTAILAGTVIATQLIGDTHSPMIGVLVCVLCISSGVGFFASLHIPLLPSGDTKVAIQFRPIKQTRLLILEWIKHRTVFYSILAISWFWFLGASYLAQFPVFAKDVLGGGVEVFTLLLACFSMGIAIGSMLCERLSRGQVEIGLVPFGALGMTVFGLDLVASIPATPIGNELGAMAFMFSSGAIRLLVDITMVGVFGGLYIVPLYGLIQVNADKSRLSSIIACNNIFNALFMVLSAIVAASFLAIGLTIPELFIALSLTNLVVAWFIFQHVPEFFIRFLAWLLVHSLYRMRSQGHHHVPKKGAALLVSNHVSFVDAILLSASIRRPVRFVMYYKIYELPVLQRLFRCMQVIPIAGSKENPLIYNRAFEAINKALQGGELVGLFPEGGITRTGNMDAFKPGVLRILNENDVPVIPIALQGLWGSVFSRCPKRSWFRQLQYSLYPVGVSIGQPLSAESVSLATLEQAVLSLHSMR